MTKADIVTKISDRLGVEKIETQAIIEQFMKEVKNSLETGENVYLRGFGSFIIKTRAEKKGRNISKMLPFRSQHKISQLLSLPKFLLIELRKR
jgi:DNA-binding protein HU-beta